MTDQDEAALASHDIAARRLDDALAAVAADHRRHDGPDAAGLARALDRLRRAILGDLMPQAPRLAAERLDRLLRLDRAVFARCDDTDGLVADVFRQALADCGRTWLAVPGCHPHRLAERVFDLFAENDHGVRDDLVPAFRDALGPAGLDALEGLIRHRLGAVPGDPAGACEAELVRALTEIADARGDLDGFITLHAQAGTEDGAVRDICERLMAAGRLEEALERVSRADAPAWRRDELDRLRIAVLDRLGRRDEAQALRRALFARTLSPTLLDAILARLPEPERAAAVAEAVAAARRHADIHRALELLAGLDLDAAASLLRQRVHDVNPRLYRMLRPLAERLAARQPLAAVLLHRRLADGVLDAADGAAYGFAVADLEAADRLSARVTDWDGHPPADVHRRDIAARHRQKRAFWERMRAAGLDWSA
ncbi:DUF6880 family protein [Azospirillum sp. ST 5-10]|uniref:DUF6880 family protein n=1 Tax=unclassified Azospirillum TaxID=2630922 RepID=UPI003F49EF28